MIVFTVYKNDIFRILNTIYVYFQLKSLYNNRILPWYQMWTKMGTKLYINDQECREEKILRSFLFSHHVLFSTSPFALSRDFKHFQISFILPVLPFYIFFQHHYFISLHFKSASYARLLKFLEKEIKYLFFFLWNVVYNHKKRLIFPIKI